LKSETGGLDGYRLRTASAVAIAAGFLFCLPPDGLGATRKPDPIPISIGGGVPESAAFRWSSVLADILSRPPGLPDCDPATACGVPDVVASAQTFDDPQALLTALIAGKISTGILPALRPFRARCGATSDPPVRTLKTLYRQKLQILVRGPGVTTPKDLGRKTIVIGVSGSDSETVALALIDAYNLSRTKIKLLRLPPPAALEALKRGDAAAGFFLGYAYEFGIAALIKNGFTLMSLPESAERTRLLQALTVFEPDAIGPETYKGLTPTSTLSQPVDWLAGPGLDPALPQRLVAAISEPHNLARIYDEVAPVPAVAEGEAFLRLPTPLAEGAAQEAEKAHLPVAVLECPAAAHAQSISR
jgi:TRAP-type uncharacterized transport system substrate-binding protein